MPRTKSKESTDRAKTDQNLHQERQNADKALAEKAAEVEANADRIVERARVDADAVLDAARDKADLKLDAAQSSAAVRAVIDEERELEDRIVERERATADENLLQEREENTRNLLALLPMERVSTDRSLLTERVGADNAVANRDDFLGIVSHDLRDLLGGIVTSCAIVLRSTEGGLADAPARVSAQRIQRYAARMGRLIEDLTDVVSIDAGKLAVTTAQGDLSTVIEEAVSSLRALATSQNVSLFADHDTPLMATFDAHRVLQVLTNLMANAIRFTPEGGRVRISSARLDDTIKISVSDTGPGIPAELNEAIFERFRQAPGSQRRGLGLGLYISRCLIEAQHGKIWAERADGHKGATVSFTLPAVT